MVRLRNTFILRRALNRTLVASHHVVVSTWARHHEDVQWEAFAHRSTTIPTCIVALESSSAGYSSATRERGAVGRKRV